MDGNLTFLLVIAFVLVAVAVIFGFVGLAVSGKQRLDDGRYLSGYALVVASCLLVFALAGGFFVGMALDFGASIYLALIVAAAVSVCWGVLTVKVFV